MGKLIIFILSIIILLTCIILFSMNSCTIDIAVYISIISSFLCVYNCIFLYDKRYSLSSAFITYTIFTQFGLIIPWFLEGNSVVEHYEYWTLRFLESTSLPNAILLGCIAITSYEISRFLTIINLQNKTFLDLDTENIETPENSHIDNKFAICLLSLTLVFFIYHILTGGLIIAGTYEQYMNSRAYNSPLYPYILIIFYIGTIYLAICGPVRLNKLGWIIWFFNVFVFAINGNKGEFLYSLLAVLGLKGVLGSKISKKIILIGIVLLFILIPSITSLRNIGITKNLSSVSFNFFSAFVEMGMQIRTSVYTLEKMNTGEIEQLWGQSYWQPIINILTPFMEHNIATSKIRSLFPGYGYNQIIESYINFKLFGPILFFSIISFLLTKYENIVKNKIQLAFLGSITTVLINATRNYFAFVPGQITICLFVYILAKRFNKNGTI